MDKYENKVKLEEINSLIKEGAYAEALDIADTIDWTTVKNIPTLGKISDLYKMMHRFEECRDILLIAYQKQNGKNIVKSLCEVSIELNDIVNAIEYCKEFVELAPRDPSRYILKYKIYKAQNISLEEQIGVLETMKEQEYKPKWAYELALLYHRVGMANKCVEECDNIILWFVDGKYVLKAFELKAQHQPLTEKEIYKYEVLRQAGGELNIDISLREPEEKPVQKKEMEIQGPEAGPVNTQNLQAVVAAGLEGMFDTKTNIYDTVDVPQTYEEAVAMDEAAKNPSEPEHTMDDSLLVTQIINPVIPEAPVGAELEADASLAAGTRSDTDIIGDAAHDMANTRLIKDYKDIQETASPELAQTGEITAEIPEYVLNQDTDEIKPITGEIPIVPVPAAKKAEQPQVKVSPEAYNEDSYFDPSNTGIIETFTKSSKMDSMLSQGYDGQISMVVPDYVAPEKQITGQISIDDVMREWENKKKAAEERRLEEIKATVRKNADDIFAGFNDTTKMTLLENLENEMINAAKKQGIPKQIKVADIDSTPVPSVPKAQPVKKEEPKVEPVSIEEEGIEEIEEIEEVAPETVVSEEPVKAEAPKVTVSEAVEEKPKAAEVEDTKEETSDIEETEDTVEETSEIEEAEDTVEEISETVEETEEEPEDIEDESEEYEDEDEDYEEEKPVRHRSHDRNLTSAERKHFEAYLRNRGVEKQLVEVLDNITLASYTGNVMVSSEENTEVTTFSKLLIQEIQMSDENFTGRVAQITGANLNKKEIVDVLEKVKNGAMIITEPQELKKKTVDNLVREMEKDGSGIVIIIQGTPDIVDKLLERNEGLARVFNLRIDLKPFDNRTLVEYARSYAYEKEYAIDEFAALELHARIDDQQTADHEVTLREVEEMVDDAIYFANKKTPKHFFDILFGKRYDKEDMIILKEKDFMHY